MSGIFGIYNRNGAPVDSGTLAAMHSAFARWFDDDHGLWCEGNVGLGHTALWNTPGSKGDHQPAVDGPQGHRLVISADVRLDNRDELLTQLGFKLPGSELTDSGLLLAAYRKWGEQCPRYLLGDFAFGIWDEQRQSLFLARDQLGIKQLYLHLCEDFLVFSSALEPLFADARVPKDLCDEAIASYLTGEETNDPQQTFYSAVVRVPAASVLAIGANALQSSVYWHGRDAAQVRYRSADDYAENLREILTQSVEARLASDYEVAAHLSGGLDSSSIAALASASLARRGKRLTTYGWLSAPTNESQRGDREWFDASQLAATLNSDHHFTHLDPELLRQIWADLNPANGDTADLWYEFPIRRHAADNNVRVLLSGWGGDQVVSNPGYFAYGDAFWRGRVITAMRHLWSDASTAPKPLRRALGLAYREVLSPVLPLFASSSRQWLIPQRVDATQAMPDQFRRFVASRKPRRGHVPGVSVRSHQLAELYSPHLAARIESWAVSGQEHALEYRYPLLDKRLVEFALGLPGELFRQQGQSRFIFRLAVAPLLPESITWDTLKAEPGRVRALASCELLALRSWIRELEDAGSMGNRYLDIPRLVPLVGSLDANQANPSADTLLNLLTAVKSLLLGKL